MKFQVYVHGVPLKSSEALPLLQDEHTLGLFESLRTYQGQKIFRLEEHLARLQESAQTSGYPYSVSKKELEKEIRKALQDFKREKADPEAPDTDVFLRVSLWQGKTFVMIGTRQHPPAIYEKGICLQTSPVRKNWANAASSQVKTSAYHNSFLASLEIKAPATYEWLFLDAQGFVTEVRIGNLFVIKGKQLRTPPAYGILHGVTRGVVIECAVRNGLEVQEVPLTRHEIYNADEAFLTNTSWEILPVAALDARRIGHRLPGTETRRLKSTFDQIIKEESL